MVEIFFGIITRQAIRRGTFTSDTGEPCALTAKQAVEQHLGVLWKDRHAEGIQFAEEGWGIWYTRPLDLARHHRLHPTPAYPRRRGRASTAQLRRPLASMVAPKG